jgi:hypothetical protein
MDPEAADKMPRYLKASTAVAIVPPEDNYFNSVLSAYRHGHVFQG